MSVEVPYLSEDYKKHARIAQEVDTTRRQDTYLDSLHRRTLLIRNSPVCTQGPCGTGQYHSTVEKNRSSRSVNLDKHTRHIRLG